MRATIGSPPFFLKSNQLAWSHSSPFPDGSQLIKCCYCFVCENSCGIEVWVKLSQERLLGKGDGLGKFNMAGVEVPSGWRYTATLATTHPIPKKTIFMLLCMALKLKDCSLNQWEMLEVKIFNIPSLRAWISSKRDHPSGSRLPLKSSVYILYKSKAGANRLIWSVFGRSSEGRTGPCQARGLERAIALLPLLAYLYIFLTDGGTQGSSGDK